MSYSIPAEMLISPNIRSQFLLIEVLNVFMKGLFTSALFGIVTNVFETVHSQGRAKTDLSNIYTMAGYVYIILFQGSFVKVIPSTFSLLRLSQWMNSQHFLYSPCYFYCMLFSVQLWQFHYLSYFFIFIFMTLHFLTSRVSCPQCFSPLLTSRIFFVSYLTNWLIWTMKVFNKIDSITPVQIQKIIIQLMIFEIFVIS